MTVAATSGPSQGWYPDPHDSSMLRWWNGTGWTEFTATLPPAAPAVQEPNTIPASSGAGPPSVPSPAPGFVLEPEADAAPELVFETAEPEPVADVIESEPAFQ